MASWPIQDAHARFEELFERSLREGPQTVTKEGVEAAVLVPIDEWRRLQGSTVAECAPVKYKDLTDWLLAPEARFDNFQDMIPPRGGARRRPPVEFD
jgi:antitoxin Phd